MLHKTWGIPALSGGQLKAQKRYDRKFEFENSETVTPPNQNIP